MIKTTAVSMSTILIIAGLLMFVVGTAYPLVTVVVDSTPPIIVSTTPADGATIPKISSISAQLRDLESGILTIGAYLYNPSGGLIMLYAPSLSSGTIYEGTWSVSFSEIATPGNNYKIYFVVKNKAGIAIDKNVYFNIYMALQGTWYVNDVEITSSTQTVYATSASVNFKFVKTAGLADSSITCTVWEGTNQILTLTNSATSTWTGSYTLALGTHTLNLKASDGTQIVTMSVIGLQVGPEGFKLPQLNILQISGLASAGIGLVLIVASKKRRKT